MPSTKEYKAKKGSKHKEKHATEAGAEVSHEANSASVDEHAEKRRPGRQGAQDIPVVEVEAAGNGEHVEPAAFATDSAPYPTESSQEEKEKVQIEFPGSEVIRSKFPKPFELAEAVATDWVKGGNFEGLPVGHPLGQLLAQQGLIKAKEFEKRILESPVTEKIAFQALTAAMRGQQLFQELKDQVQKVKEQVKGKKD